ncbi:MAG: TerB family tellurite resistance protein [Verrucomicrobiales bacterium]
MSMQHFSTPQRSALIDLVVLAMYADGHLALKENTALKKIMATLGLEDELARDRELDAAVARVRTCAGNTDLTAAHIRQSAIAFSSGEDRQMIQQMLTEMMSSDEKVTPEEEKLLKTVAELLPAR